MIELSFLGATGTVTGSRYLVTHDGMRILVDCGLFQGLKQLRLKNRAPFPIAPAQINAVILTHAHVDHSGYLPLLVKNGFAGPVYCTEATADLCRILLPDSGHLAEEEARHANRHAYSKHHPALPLYTRADAERCLGQLTPVPFHQEMKVEGSSFRFERAGHILGAASVTLLCAGQRIVFSGDLGPLHDPVLHPPEHIASADYLIVESTYGDRVHGVEDVDSLLADAIKRAAQRGGVVVIPSFAVGRAQRLLYHIQKLMSSGRIPDVPVYMDSPMAGDVTRLLKRHRSEHQLSDADIEAMFGLVRITTSPEESKAIDMANGPFIVISASGMATGGRVLFHLRRFAGDERNMILLVGYQAAGTRGAALQAGAAQLKIFGSYVPVRAEVVSLHGLSAHADADALLEWLKGFEQAPRRTFITHGEPVAADALRRRIQEELHWNVSVPEALSVARL